MILVSGNVLVCLSAALTSHSYVITSQIVLTELMRVKDVILQNVNIKLVFVQMVASKLQMYVNNHRKTIVLQKVKFLLFFSVGCNHLIILYNFLRVLCAFVHLVKCYRMTL